MNDKSDSVTSKTGVQMLEPYRSGFRDAIIEAKKRIRENGSRVGAETERWFDEIIGGATPETSEQRTPVERALARRVYIKSERHLSGYRLVIGFETLTDIQAAHQEVADVQRAALKAFVQLCAPHGKDWLTCPECAKAAGIGNQR